MRRAIGFLHLASPFQSSRSVLHLSHFPHHSNRPLCSTRPRYSIMSASPDDVPVTIATHDGTFHADEALACHMLQKHTTPFRNATIIRTRDTATLSTASIVVDVGAAYNPSTHRYDHHQRPFANTLDSTGPRSHTKLSSAGLIYKHFGHDVISSILSACNITLTEREKTAVYGRVYDGFVEHIDAIDNGIQQYVSDEPPRYEAHTDLSSRVARLNADWYEDNADQDANFAKALQLVGDEFDSYVQHVARSWLPARNIVSSAFRTRREVDPSGRILVLKAYAPWKGHLFNLEKEEEEESKQREDSEVNGEKGIFETLYVVYKDMTGSSWRVQCVPVSMQSFQSRRPLPEAWRGLRDDALSKVSGIPGCIFVHASGFIGGNATYDGAMALARNALNMQ